MARRTKIFTADVDRDKGKRFLLTEMSALRGEEWALRLLFLLINHGVDLPKGVDFRSAAGMATLAGKGLEAVMNKLSFEEAKPLLDEMMRCVQFIPPAAPSVALPLLMDDSCQIEEIQTLLQIKKEVAALHVNFLQAAKSQISESASTESKV